MMHESLEDKEQIEDAHLVTSTASLNLQRSLDPAHTNEQGG